MAREHETSVQPWGTLEELLLACAVNRHGTKSWDSIAMEVQNRTSSSSAFFLTPENCKHKFDDLKRRFMMSDKDGDDGESSSSAMVVDQLKRIRVDELRREVLRRDVSIVSLEFKVKRLEEERERSIKEEDQSEPEKKKNREGDDGVAGAGDGDGETSSENHGGGGGGGRRSKSGDDGSESCDRENRSFNESNSTSQKRSDLQRNGYVFGKSEPGPEPERNKSDRVGSEREGKAEEEEGDDVAQRENSAKQSSEAQSSMSLSKRKRRLVGSSSGGGGGGRGGSSSGEEPEEAEGEEVSPATKRLSAIKSEPFVKLLRIIRSHRLGSVFQRRLRSQESQRYKNLIRQHMDLQTVEARLEKGLYLDSSRKFFRDLLLVFNNGVVFFRIGSQEHVAARELRALVLKEMKSGKKPGKSQALTVKREDGSVLPKPHNNNVVKKSSIMVTCGKRGGSSAKSLSSEMSKKGGDHKKERMVEEKQKSVNMKKINGSFVAIDDKGIRKKRSQERAGRRGGLRTGNNGSGESEREFGGNELSSHDALEVKMDKKETVKKKQGVASFLKRMKQNSPKHAAEEDVSEEDSEASKVEKEEKKKTKGKLKKSSSPIKDRVTRSSTHGKATKEDSRKAKRGVGRPPKRPEKVTTTNGKRGRGNADQSEAGVVGGRPTKRSRR